MASSGVAPSSPPPLHAVRSERMLLGGCPLLLLLDRGVPPFPLWHTVHWERTLLFGGAPPFLQAWPPHGGFARRALLGMRSPLFVLGPVTWGSRAAMFRGSPCAPAARHGRVLLGGGSLSPSPPSAAAHIKRARPFRGRLASVGHLSGSCAGSACCGVSCSSSSVPVPSWFSEDPWPPSPLAAPAVA